MRFFSGILQVFQNVLHAFQYAKNTTFGPKTDKNTGGLALNTAHSTIRVTCSFFFTAEL